MKNYLFILLFASFFTSCYVQTKGVKYADLYEEDPVSILLMPPINQTNSVEAKTYFYSTLYKPLCEKGYYVYSPLLTMEMLQSESAYDSEQFIDADLSKFREITGADAVLFTIIKRWDKNTALKKIVADVEFQLRSTKTGQILFQREGQKTLGPRTWFGTYMALTNVFKLVNTVRREKIKAGRECTEIVLDDLPEGKYGLHYKKDVNAKTGKSIIKE